MSKVKEKSTDRASIRKEVRTLLRMRQHITDKVSDAEKELNDINEGLYDAYEQLNIKSYKFKGLNYRVQQNAYHKWDFKSLRRFLRNKYSAKMANSVIEKEEKIIESVNDEQLQNLIDSIKGKKSKEEFRTKLGMLVEITHSKKFIRVSKK